MTNDLVAYSRAGDVFHYRWAARRCLGLVYPDTTLTSVFIEGSKEDKKSGEYVIDVSEYYKSTTRAKVIQYYQLKHTTVQNEVPFGLSHLKKTLKGFAERYSQHEGEQEPPTFSFTIITNRTIDTTFKQAIQLLARGKAPADFRKKIEKATGLGGTKLRRFCGLLRFEDSQGDYDTQEYELRQEIAQLVSGSVENAQIDSLVGLVQKKVLPKSSGEILPEEVLKIFGYTSEKDLFPAPAILEADENLIDRPLYPKVREQLSSAKYPVILHAPGGVGKSVFCRQLALNLPEGSLAIIYDCFGAGRYRNRSEPRHRHRDALVQIVNELSVKGLCDPLLVQDVNHDSDIMKKFLWRIQAATRTLRETTPEATLYLLIDAADNAEMAALEFNEACFAHELLRETIPEGCQPVLLCRTERINLLQPTSNTLQFDLSPFSAPETLEHLQKWYIEASEKEGAEFHRLTGGNPRVQANALSVPADSVTELLNRLGPEGTTVEQQIEQQLATAVTKIKDHLTESFQQQVHAICIGLASLPPHIPIKILAKAAGVSAEDIVSFAADMGRALWISDASVQFRDEPTETWFRNHFLAGKNDFEEYIKVLEPLAQESTYVAEVLPHLYLQAGHYQKLIELAMSDLYLPKNHPIDARSIRVNRLQFAIRAALRDKRFDDAAKIAIRAGEEVAGNERQSNLFKDNIDLLCLLQDPQKIQELALKRTLNGSWNGAENVYAASLLSGIEDYKGEATAFLRSAINWLIIYYNELKASDDQRAHNEVSKTEVLELAWATFNIHGVAGCVQFLDRFRSNDYKFRIMQLLTSRLIDAGRFEVINAFMLCCSKDAYFMLAITHTLFKVGRFAGKKYVEPCLDLLCDPKFRPKKSDYSRGPDDITIAVVAFIEVSMRQELPTEKLLEVLKYYVPAKASKMVGSDYQSSERTVYLKTFALRVLLKGEASLNTDSILPRELLEKKKKEDQKSKDEVSKFTKVFESLFPWYLLRAKLLCQKVEHFRQEAEDAKDGSAKARGQRNVYHDTLPNELAALYSSILIIHDSGTTEELSWFYDTFIGNRKDLWIPDELQLLRATFRNVHLSCFKGRFEKNFYERIDDVEDSGPEDNARHLTDLARAVYCGDPKDSAVYFEEAIVIVSRFGDEIAGRWDAVVSLAEQASRGSITQDLAYRFIRCAEVVGQNVSRERYWDRSKAIAVGTRMHAGTGIAALSRWRDRGVGRFELQLKALLSELVQTSKITPITGWAFARFFAQHPPDDLLNSCLEQEQNEAVKQALFDDAMDLMLKEGASADDRKKMQTIVLAHKIDSPRLDTIQSQFEGVVAPETADKDTFKRVVPPPTEAEQESMAVIFDGIDLSAPDELEKCLKAFKDINKKSLSYDPAYFWNRIIGKFAEPDWESFLNLLVSSNLTRYDISQAIECLPETWKQKVSFKKKWPGLIQKLGAKFAYELASPYTLGFFSHDLKLDTHEMSLLQAGMFDGLATGYEFTNEEMFFGFAKIAAPILTAEQAIAILDFALSRFELHFTEESGDGPWQSWLATPDNIASNLAGFIWSALGSPRSTERWNAAHCIRVLARFNCTDIFHELFYWLQQDQAGPFGHPQFTFYKLHARQYFLIAIARIARDQPDLMLPFKDVFVHYALHKPHILMQRLSAEIALTLAAFSTGLYDEPTINQLKMAGKSQLPVLDVKDMKEKDSYWHSKGLIDTKYDFHFGWDFNQYWFEPLGKTFGIPGEQVADLAADTVIKQWGITEKNGYKNDPREYLWSRRPNEKDTWHDHGSYPRTDHLDFYHSYHSMMVAAARLIEKMPLVRKPHYEDQWGGWISRHWLTSNNGWWVSDYRDAVPFKRPEWIYQPEPDNWIKGIKDTALNQLLFDDAKGDSWLYVRGGWSERNSERSEYFSVDSALVSKGTSHALLRALQTCSDPHDYKLPSYGETDMEIDSGPFSLKGWIEDDSISKKLDQFDPYGDQLDFPPYQIGAEIADRLQLSTDAAGKSWYLPGSDKAVASSETWSSYLEDRSEYPDQAGKRIGVSKTVLQKLCAVLDCALILRVGIHREMNYKYRKEAEGKSYSNLQYKIFILSEDGTIKGI